MSNDTEEKVDSTAASRPKWTVLIYFAGDNNLSEECVFALKEMQAAGTKDYNVVVQFDPAGQGNPTRRLKFRGRTANQDLGEQITFQKLDETDTGAHTTLLNFLVSSIEKFGDEYLMVILSGHGGGTDEDFFLRDEDRPQSLSPRSLSLPDLKRVFEHPSLAKALGARKINILGLDACVMSMVEVCFQLRNSRVELLAGSEGFSANAGWPYGKLLSLLNKDPHIDPERLAQALPDLYTEAYKDYSLGGLSADLAILKVNKVRNLRDKVKKLANVMRQQLPDELDEQFGLRHPFQRAIVQAHWLAQSYNGEQSTDLHDFCSCLLRCCELEACLTPAVKNACEELQNAIANSEDSIVLRAVSTGPEFQYSNGVSIYFPWSEAETGPHYKGLDFVKDESTAQIENRMGWFNFLRRYMKSTQRPPIPENRFTPPYNRGPGKLAVRSMKNPPRSRGTEKKEPFDNNADARAH